MGENVQKKTTVKKSITLQFPVNKAKLLYYNLQSCKFAAKRFFSVWLLLSLVKINHFDISQVRRRGCEKKRKNWNEVKRKRQQISGSTICSVLYGQRSGSLCVGNWRSLCKRQLKFLLLFYVYCWLLCFRHFSLIRIFFFRPCLCTTNLVIAMNEKKAKERNDYENSNTKKASRLF